MFLLQDLTVNEDRMFEDKIELTLNMTSEYKDNLERIVKFNCLVYVPYFLTASHGSNTPINDLNLLKVIDNYKVIDPDISTAVLSVLRRHSYYLYEELVPLSFFSNKITEDEKSRMAVKLLMTENHQSTLLESQ